MRVLTFVYDSETTPRHVETILELLDGRDETPDRLDVAAGNPADARREAMLVIKDAVRIGTVPDELFDDGRPDFSPGALITEAETGRRRLHVGEEALTAIEDEA